MIKFYLAVICFTLYSCGPKEISKEELQSYILDEDNGLRKSAEFNGTNISVTYRPTDLWVDQEVGDKIVDKASIDSLRGKYSSYYYFIVSLSRNNKEALHQVASMSEYSEIVQTMSFRMPEHVTLTTTKQDTIPVGDFMLNRTYGLSSSTDILFAFNREKANGNSWVQFNLNEFGLGLGNQGFRFSIKDFEQTPILNFNIDN